MKQVDALVIGGGCAGLAAAVALKKNGIQEVVVIEKDDDVGGILNQCIHNGFGLTTFKEQLSGPSFAQRFYEQCEEYNVTFKTGTMVTHISKEKEVTYVNEEEGYQTVQAKAIILAVGCYERSRGAVVIPGERPSGIYTAGQAQRYLNIDGYLVGKRVFILGSGDIGLIMARRMTLEGAKVLGVAELMPYSNGLPRNMKQCLEDFDIPLYLSHTVTNIKGHTRLEQIEISQVDENRRPIKGTEKSFDVDTLLLSIGLIPENHLADEAGIVSDPKTKGPIVDDCYMTSVEGIFACGNGLHVHDLADYAAHQGSVAGENAANYIKNGKQIEKTIQVIPGNQVGYVVPAKIHCPIQSKVIELFFRCKQPLKNVDICIHSKEKNIRTIHKDVMVPSEMENILIASKQLEGIEDELVVEIKEGN